MRSPRLAAAVGKGARLPASHADLAGVPSTVTTDNLIAWIVHIIETALLARQSKSEPQTRAANLERRRHREPESLAWLPQQETGSVRIHCQVISVVPSRASWEHGARNGDWRVRRTVEPQRIVGPVDAEGRINHRQEHLQFESRRDARLPVRRAQYLQVLGRLRVQDASTLTVIARIEGRTSEWRTDH